MKQEYERVVLECSGQFSVGKHFWSADYGVFTEVISRLNRKTLPLREQRRQNHLVEDDYPLLG